MTQRQEEYYKNNPSKLDELKEITSFALYNTSEGRNVTKYFQKFMSKNYGLSFDKINFIDISEQYKNELREFWRRNGWAKEKFSIAFSKAREILKTQEKQTATFHQCTKFKIYPDKISEKIKLYAQKRNIPTTGIEFGTLYFDAKEKEDEELPKEVTLAQNIVDKYFANNQKDANDAVTSILYAFCDLLNEIKYEKARLPKDTRRDKEKMAILFKGANHIIAEHKIFKFGYTADNLCVVAPKSGIPSTKVYDAVLQFASLLYGVNSEDMLDHFSDLINQKYLLLTQISRK